MLCLGLLFSSCLSEAPITAPPGGTGFPLGLSLEELVGTWQATHAVLTPIDGAQPLDLISAGGEALLEVVNNGRFTLILTNADNESQIVTGQMDSNNGSIDIILDSDTDIIQSWTLIKTGDLLSITGTLDYKFAEGLGTEEARFNTQWRL